mmetsp:Transcript_731/g.1616  ORF Transcript_731/g.1616 Transcript_731/m.1616 type:complete len:227 (+) Transcript_731:74-754(+)
MRARVSATSSEPPGERGGLTSSANSSDTSSCSEGRCRRLSWKDWRPLAAPVKENVVCGDGVGTSPSCIGGSRQAAEGGRMPCVVGEGTQVLTNFEHTGATLALDADRIALGDVDWTSSSGPEGCRMLLCYKQALIDDRRSSPSKADHGMIINSFQQGLASVEIVIIYDNDSVHSDMENEHSLWQGVWTWSISRLLFQLGEACAGICKCHDGLAGALSTLHLSGGWR